MSLFSLSLVSLLIIDSFFILLKINFKIGDLGAWTSRKGSDDYDDRIDLDQFRFSRFLHVDLLNIDFLWKIRDTENQAYHTGLIGTYTTRVVVSEFTVH